jgi:LemA protein
MAALIVISLLAVCLVVGGTIITYNALMTRYLETENAWSQIDVQLKRRHDLIPNLVEVVRGYAGHERQVLENVTRAKDLAMGVSGRAGLAEAENELMSPLARLFVLVEAYPQLKANLNFQRLHDELRGTESRVSFARQYYNDTVARYNTLVERFPANLLAGLCGFKPAEFLRLAADEAAMPKVNSASLEDNR